VCVLPFPDGGVTLTHWFILVRAKEGPMSNEEGDLYYLGPKCLYRDG
jgi:hypothetical protein